jgi:hypothetical protein
MISIETAKRDNAKEALADFGAYCRSQYSLTEGEVLLALARKRDNLDSFTVFLVLWGNMMHYFSPLVTTTISVFSLFLFLKKVADTSFDFFKWIQSSIGIFPAAFSAVNQAMGVASMIGLTPHTLIGGDTNGTQQDLATVFRITKNALYGMALGFLPPGISGLVNVAVGELLTDMDAATIRKA